MTDFEKSLPGAPVQEYFHVRVTDVDGSGASYGEVKLSLVRHELEVDMDALAEAVRVWLLDNVPAADTSTIIKTTVREEISNFARSQD
jgi:hypothetical protein